MQSQNPTPLKLKQASSVLDLDPKELQNLVQFNIVSPQMSGDRYFVQDRRSLPGASGKYIENSTWNEDAKCAHSLGQHSFKLG
jgi:hypothetical protein